MQKINQLIIAIFLVAGIFSGASASEPTLTGTHLLDSMGRNLPALRQGQVRRVRNNFQLGDLHNFKTFNFAAKKWEETPARLVKAGEHICLYLEEGQTVEETILDGLIKEFDSVIYPTTAKYFGNEARPGIDGDSRLTVLLMDIRDDAETSGVYTSGYFNRADCYLPAEIPAGSDLQSNCREMLYADINPSDITSKEFYATIAHELQHLIHFFHDQKEYDWLNEGCSQMAPWLCGYGHPRQISAWQKTPDNSLLAWAPWQQVANYGQVYLWSYYVMNKFCSDAGERVKFFRELVADQDQGMASYDKLFKARGTTFEALFNNFCISSFINRKDVKPALLSFGEDLAGFQLPATTFIDRLPTTYRNNVSIWGADLVKVAIQSGAAEIKVGFAGDLNSLPNAFSVALVFFNESEAKVCQISYIDNIKSTTPNRPAHTARVMLHGQGDDYYPPPPPVKTQMGDITAKVPAGSDMLYLVIMGKGPADLPDSMLSWSGKATYRIDIEVTASHPAPAAAAPTVVANAAALLDNYVALKADLQSAAAYEETHAAFTAVEAELKAALKAELADNGREKKLFEILQTGSEDFAELKAFCAEVQNFNHLHH